MNDCGGLSLNEVLQKNVMRREEGFVNKLETKQI